MPSIESLLSFNTLLLVSYLLLIYATIKFSMRNFYFVVASFILFLVGKIASEISVLASEPSLNDYIKTEIDSV